MAPLTLEGATRIVDVALRTARDSELKSMAVVVLDAGGHDIVLKREDGCGILRRAAQGRSGLTLFLEDKHRRR